MYCYKKIKNWNYYYSLRKNNPYLQFVIADGNTGIMVLLRRNYLIDMMNDHRNEPVKVTIRFFNIEDHIIHTTERTEIELDDTVQKYVLYYTLRIIV